MYACPGGPNQKLPPRMKLSSHPHRLSPSANDVLASNTIGSIEEHSFPEGDVSCAPSVPVPFCPYCEVRFEIENLREVALDVSPLSATGTPWDWSCQLHLGSSS